MEQVHPVVLFASANQHQHGWQHLLISRPLQGLNIPRLRPDDLILTTGHEAVNTASLAWVLQWSVYHDQSRALWRRHVAHSKHFHWIP